MCNRTQISLQKEKEIDLLWITNSASEYAESCREVFPAGISVQLEPSNSDCLISEAIKI